MIILMTYLTKNDGTLSISSTHNINFEDYLKNRYFLYAKLNSKAIFIK